MRHVAPHRFFLTLKLPYMCSSVRIFVAWSVKMHAYQGIRQDPNNTWVVTSFLYISHCLTWSTRFFDQLRKEEKKENKTKRTIPTNFQVNHREKFLLSTSWKQNLLHGWKMCLLLENGQYKTLFKSFEGSTAKYASGPKPQLNISMTLSVQLIRIEKSLIC